jgi:hypothetical protein
MEGNKLAFQNEMSQINRELETIYALDKINSELRKFNWIFLHPYSHGIDVEHIGKLISDSDKAEEAISNFFATRFLDLRTTIHFIEGFYKKRPFLKDYVASIEESVLLCLQKDFKGAINILLPVIEGTLRKYLISRLGDQQKTEIKISKLLKSIDILTDEYMELQKRYLKDQYRLLIETNNYFDLNQEAQILKKKRLYFELWMKQLRIYLENNLYLDTRNGNTIDTFNRHIIFHALEDNIDFSFSNYLRLFNCVNFLSWAIGLTNEDCSILPDSDDNVVNDKWIDFLRILIVSEATSEVKSRIYGKSLGSFKNYLQEMDRTIVNIYKTEETIRKELSRFDALMKDRRFVANTVSRVFKNGMFYMKLSRALKNIGK